MIRIAALALAVATTAEPPRSLDLLVWGDLHGDPSPKLFSWVDSLRRNADAWKRPMLALDAGDAIFGSDVSFITRGASQARLLNLVQPDAITLGARDFWWTRDRLDTLIGTLQVPVVTNNIRFALSDKPYGGKNWAMWDFDGLRVGLIGVGNPDLEAADRPAKAYDLRSYEPTETVQSSMDELRDRDVSVIVVLSHAGREADIALATAQPDIDVIVGSRDEEPEAPIKVGATWIVRTATGPNRLTRIDMNLTDTGVALEANTAEPANVATPKEWKPVFDSLAKVLKTRTDLALDTLKEAWPKTSREGLLGNFLADALRREAGADIGLWPSSSLRGGLAKGKVTVGDLWKVLPSPQLVSVFEIPGSDVQRMLLRQMTRPRDFLFLSGASCTSDSSRFGGSPIQVFVDGKPIQPSGRYKIAIPNAVRESMFDLTGFSLESAAPQYLERWDRDMIEAYIRSNRMRTSVGRVPAMYGALR
jgi:5'-nucleotidase/UDP-sugar diphosphatase